MKLLRCRRSISESADQHRHSSINQLIVQVAGGLQLSRHFVCIVDENTFISGGDF